MHNQPDYCKYMPPLPPEYINNSWHRFVRMQKQKKFQVIYISGVTSDSNNQLKFVRENILALIQEMKTGEIFPE
jgi:hypothetical protein